MEFLGIGPLELFFVILIALIVLGPKEMVKAGRTLGRFLRKVVTSPSWRTVQDASRELRYLPNRLMREAGIEDIKNQLPDPKQISRDLGMDQLNAELKQMQADVSDWTTPPPAVPSKPSQDASEAMPEPEPEPAPTDPVSPVDQN